MLEARQRHGPNDIVEAVEHPWWALARDTASNPMIWFFAGTSALYGIVGQVAEAATLLGAIVPLVLMDIFLHRRTQASTEGLKSRLASRATAVRDGVPIEVAARDVVPGDLAIVMTGEPFPADGIVLTGADLQVDESSLTGESFPVRKRPMTAPTHANDELRVGREQWVFAGTRLLTGRARCLSRIRAARPSTEKSSGLPKVATQTRTPLQRAIQGLVVALSAAALALCAIPDHRPPTPRPWVAGRDHQRGHTGHGRPARGISGGVRIFSWRRSVPPREKRCARPSRRERGEHWTGQLHLFG